MMNKGWSDKNKEFQKLISKKATYKEGIQVLIELRNELFEEIIRFVKEIPASEFSAMPFKGAKGYHSKTLAYSVWHIFRIEDIVAHEMIAKNEQILFWGDWQAKIGSPIITTGNELQGDQIKQFSESLDVNTLYEYTDAVKEASDNILSNLNYSDLKAKFSSSDKAKLIATNCVSSDENAAWLIDYWCGKDVAGLLKMPFSRHWIMHIEAMLRIKTKLKL